MIHTITEVENICTTLKNLESVMDTITERNEKAKKAKSGVRDARDYILSLVNNDKDFADMCKLYKTSLDMGLAYIDICNEYPYFNPKDITDLMNEFGVSKFTMSMCNKYTTYYCAVFCDNGFNLEGVHKLNNGEYAFEFESK